MKHPTKMPADCSSCGAILEVSGKFCSECGARLGIRCAACGSLIEPEALFCGECGERAPTKDDSFVEKQSLLTPQADDPTSDHQSVFQDEGKCSLTEEEWPVPVVEISYDLPDPDPLYAETVERVLMSNRTSISSVQRWFRIPYARAERLIERMERESLLTTLQPDNTRKLIAQSGTHPSKTPVEPKAQAASSLFARFFKK